MAQWPRELIAAIRLVLEARSAMAVAWSEESFLFCNEACRELLSCGPVPKTGAPAREAWSPFWKSLEQAAHSVLSTGLPAVEELSANSVPANGATGRHQFRFVLSPLPDEGGKTGGFLCTLEKIPSSSRPRPRSKAAWSLSTRPARGASRSDLEAALRESEARISQLVTLMPAAVYTCDQEGRISYFNRQAATLWGREPRLGDEDRRFCGSLRLWRSDGRQLPHEETPMAVAIQTGRSTRNEEVIIEQPSGRRIAVSVNIDPLRDADGRNLGAINVFFDVTDRNRTAEALQESEQRFARFMRHLPGLAWIKDDEGRYVFVNEAAARAFDRPMDRILGCRDDELFPPEIAAQFRRNDLAALAHERGLQTVETLRHPDGRDRHSLVSKFPISSGDGRPPFVGGMAIDITDRQEAEIALQAAHDRLEQRVQERTSELEKANSRLQAIYDQGLYAGLIALDGRLADVNRLWLEASGFKAEDVLDRPFWEAGWWDRSDEQQAWLKIGFAEAVQGARFRGETTCKTADGNGRWLDLALTPLWEDSGDVQFVLATGIDVTDRHRAEEELKQLEVARETESRFRLMADSAPVLIWMADTDNAGVWFNKQWLDFVGRPLEREVGHGWLENVHPDDAGRCARQCDEAFGARRPFKMEFRLRRHDSEYRWVLDHGVPTFGFDGVFTGYIGTCIDISERRAAESTRRRLAAIVECSEDAIIGKNLDGIITNWNGAAQRLFGYAAEEILGQPITRLIPPDRQYEEPGIIDRIRRGEPIQHYETVRIRKDGTCFDVSLSISPVRDAAGRVVGAAKILRDISGRKRTERELRRREELYRAIGESIDYGIWICDAEGRNTYASESFLELTGLTQEECSSFGWGRVLHPDDADATLAAWRACVAEGVRWEREHRIRGVDGAWHPVLARGVPVRDEQGRIVCWAGINLDIGRLKANEEALRRKTRNLELLNQVGRTLVAERELKNVVQTVTDAGREASGAAFGAFFHTITDDKGDSLLLYTLSGARREDFEKFGNPRLTSLFGPTLRGEGVVRVGDVLQDSRYGRMPPHHGMPAGHLPVRSYLAVPVVSHSGAVHGGLFFGHPEPDVFTAEAEDLVVAIAGQTAIALDNANLFRDMQYQLEEREKAGRALRESENRFRMLADNIAALAWTADRLGWATWYNKRWYEYTGRAFADMQGDGWESVHHPDHVERVRTGVADCLQRGAPWEDTFPLRRHDGVYRWFLSRAVPIRDEEGRVVQWFGTNTDVTDLREAERALERARDEALAASRAKDEFLAALSHELRTPLNPVLLLASDAAENKGLSEEVRADFETIRKNVSLEARLIDDLLDLTRIARDKLSLDLADHAAHPILQDALLTIEPEAREKGVALALRLEATQDQVRADPVRLQQVFWNVLKNAVKFTPAGGRIEVGSDTQDGKLLVTVSDTGIGMTADEIERVFDAFAQGNHARGPETHRFGGLGLGLAISRKVIEMHQGSIRASSEGQGQGTSFEIELPLAPGASPARAALSTAPKTARTADAARILLVEDHEPTRLTLQRLLNRRGHEVVVAGTLNEALELAHAGRFDLLISDVGLPDGSGCELMRTCAERYGLKGIALTGYGMEQDTARTREAGFSAHLTKPVDIAALDSAIGDLIRK